MTEHMYVASEYSLLCKQVLRPRPGKLGLGVFDSGRGVPYINCLSFPWFNDWGASRVGY